jgi:hypothetical protein
MIDPKHERGLKTIKMESYDACQFEKAIKNNLERMKLPNHDIFKAKYIHFKKIEDKPKTSVWSCRNNSGDYQIGIVKWNPGWRQYCFFSEPDMVFSIGCMEDICKFISTLKEMKS